jgi:predicted metal-binding membrane protein
MPAVPHIEPRIPSACIYVGASGLIFGASTAVTIGWGLSMTAMGGMPMAGGWTMSMAWMPMCGQSWFEAAGSFLGMWAVMMVAMMMPSLMPMLDRYRRRVAGAGRGGLGRLTVIAGAGYFFVWTLLGMLLFPAGAGLAAAAMASSELSRIAPLAGGLVVLVAGALQFTAWKARQLARCREVPVSNVEADAGSAWRHGLHIGVQCCLSCAGPLATLIVLGVMDLRAMAVVTAAVTAERLAPDSAPIARTTGVVAVGTGLLLIMRAALGLA